MATAKKASRRRSARPQLTSSGEGGAVLQAGVGTLLNMTGVLAVGGAVLLCLLLAAKLS